MNVIIPAKGDSQRVPNKNWREFHDGQSLTEIKIQQVLRAGIHPSCIHVSSDDESKAGPVCERTGVKFLLRPPGLTDNAVPLTTWIRAITAQVPGDDDIAWIQVTDPFFDADSIGLMLSSWETMRRSHDSYVAAYPWKGYLMTDTGQPVGWSFGEHHTPSQKLPQWLTMPFSMSILTRASIDRTGYHVGADPAWYIHDGPSMDIDTEWDFRIAQMLFSDQAVRQWDVDESGIQAGRIRCQNYPEMT